MAEWEQAHARRVRAQRILTALATMPERPGGDRLAHAATSVLEGGTWNDPAVGAGWAGRKGMDAEIARLLRAVELSGLPRGGD